MAMIPLNLRPTDRELRQFGWIALAAFGLLGVLLYTQWLPLAARLGRAGPIVAYVLWTVGAISACFSLLAPRANRPLYAGLMLAAFPIGWVISHVIMAVVFFGLLTPIGVFFRLIGRDPLQRRFEPQASTYWIPHRPAETLERYFRQY